MASGRLVAIILLLRSRGRVSAAWLAERLEVSVATIRRDMERLSAAGVPVYAERGRGGGWQLLDGWSSDLGDLTDDEALALVSGAGGAAESLAAREKLLAALPSRLREPARVAAESLLEDPRRWGELPTPVPVEVPALQRAVARQRRVRLSYRTSVGRVRDEVVDPLGIIRTTGAWYLLCRTDRGVRTYRIDRARDVRVLDDRFERDGLDVAELWRQASERIERLRGGLVATTRVRAGYAEAFVGRVGAQARVIERGAAEWVVEVSAPTAWMLATQLAGWVGVVDVDGPPEVRAALRDIGQRLMVANQESHSNG